MNTQTTDVRELLTTPVRRGFPGLSCPLCGTTEDVQSLDLDDLSTFRCGGCDDTYTADDIRERMAVWQRVLNWIDSAPTA